SQSGLNSAFGDLAIDQSDDIWIADANNNRILEFRPPFSNGMNSSLVIGQKDFVTTTQAGFGLGYGWVITFDPAGNLWVTYNNRLLEFKPPFTMGMTITQASLEIGQSNFTSSEWTGGQNGFSGINKPGFDSSGNLWVPDGGNNRVLEFSCSDVCTTSGSTSTTGQAHLPFGQFQLVVIGAVILVVVAGLGGVFIRKRGQIGSPT
ncbi:MAG: hypothetical protein OK457_06325, partial [Thaumarchaeota archaeon]|nr:hypothetical protein [Nitrososphaerota archaeon]